MATRSLLPALLVLLGALLPGSGGAGTSVQPPEATIPRGGSVVVTCSATCDQNATLGLETPLTKKQINQGQNWVTYELSGIQENSTPLCFSNCGARQTQASVSLTVYWFPVSVELAPLPQWHPVGENLTLHCQVEGGAPRSHLSVMLLQGEKVLAQQPAVGEPAEVTATVLAGRDDHGTNFSCRTELDLRTQGLGLFQNRSIPRKLQTFVLPKIGPRLATPRIMEVGTHWPVNCSLDGLFPVSEAQVHLALEDQRLEPTVKYSKDTLWATAWAKVNAGEEGAQQLRCTVMLGNQSQRTAEKVTVYSFPAPNLTLSELVVPEGTVVTVECKAHPRAVVTLSGAPVGTPGPRAQFMLNASAEDNGRSFLCSAVLKVDGTKLHKNETQELTVLYGPRLDESDCPGNWTVQEGSQQTLKCQAWGNPVPKVNCHRIDDGASLPIGVLRPVMRNISGTYKCRAISPRGEVTREVVVNVNYHHQNNIVVIVLVAAAVILATVGTAAYFYNRQRKIREYKLRKAQETYNNMKLNTSP
ncbi:intercellular adhesion molecule 1 isoform X1 [Pteronotus mesoamericanus]|uniref:intercellular adhesion molecule 1 isoform X1 n=1 Tax=Pteronotus mesoamericanus TaxID=1884717 RepID=UPI0023EB9371|nr:intercellular adhesion molecule 1 isoform X1 [Pteronotus parnellii mesoamericanus]